MMRQSLLLLAPFLLLASCSEEFVAGPSSPTTVQLAPRLVDAATGGFPAQVQKVHVRLEVGAAGSPDLWVKDTLLAWQSKSLSLLSVPTGKPYRLLLQGRNDDDPDSCWLWSGSKADTVTAVDQKVQADAFAVGSLTTPVLDKHSGTYSKAVSVAVNGPNGATVHYTLDGTAPDALSEALNGASVTISSSRWLRARAFAPIEGGGFLCSPAAEDSFTILAGTLLASPTLLPADTAFTRPTTLKVSAPSGALAWYSIDGKNYLAATGDTLRIAQSQRVLLRSCSLTSQDTCGTIRAIDFVVAPDSVTQAVLFGTPGGTYRSSQLVKLSSGTPGAVIRYTFRTDLTTSSVSEWSVYSGPLLIAPGAGQQVTLSAYAALPGKSLSPITRATYYIQP